MTEDITIKEKAPKATSSTTTIEGQQQAVVSTALMMQTEDKEASGSSSNTNKAMNLAAKWIQLQAQFALRLQQQQQQLEADEVAVDKMVVVGNKISNEPPTRFPLDLSPASPHR